MEQKEKTTIKESSIKTPDNTRLVRNKHKSHVPWQRLTLSLLGIANTNNLLGYTKDSFAQAEGFKDWIDFQKNNKFSEAFITGKGSRYVYSIKPIFNNEAELLKAQKAEFSKIVKDNIEFSPAKIVVQYLPLLTPASVKKETGLSVGVKSDINPSLLSVNGVTVQQAAHNIWASHFSESKTSESDIRNMILDIISVGKKEFEKRLTSQDNSESEIPKCS